MAGSVLAPPTRAPSAPPERPAAPPLVSVAPPLVRWGRHLATAGLCGLAAFALFAILSGRLDPRLLERATFDVWFQADLTRVFEDMTQRWVGHARTSHHPAFPLLAYAPTYALRTVLGLEPALAARLVVASVGALWTVLLFLSLRLMGLNLAGSLLFTAAGATSASALAWFTVPETFPFGSLAIAFGVFTVAAGARRLRRGEWDVLASAAMLATTKTNWVIGMVASLARHGWRAVPRIAINAFALVVVLWSVQDWIFPDTTWFLARGRSETAAILPSDALGFLGVARSLFVHTLVFPAIAVIDFPNVGEWPLLLTQRAGIGSAGLLGLLASLAWMALLVLGVVHGLRSPRHRRLTVFLLLALLSQLVLHAVFGDETFLYSAHFLPLLVVLAALATRGPRPRLVLALAALALVAGGINNLTQFSRAAGFLDAWAPYHHSLRAAMEERPGDDWQRPESDRFSATEMLDGAWYGPGGSAYPVAGTFGITVWVRDPVTGARIASSNDVPLEQVREASFGPELLPRGWEVTTPWYRARWEAVGPRDLTLDLEPTDAPLELVVRGSAPRDAGPLRSLEVVGDTLILNERWRLAPVDGPVHLGVESPGWQEAPGSLRRVEDPGGWAYARIPLGTGARHVRVWDAEGRGPVGRVLAWIPERH
ncbi:MAG: hypothetical protein R3E98_05390 [Gemmatimonadota bacterium]|nr:hypothetical protein [Gemmatimonadota bacterium]